MIRFACERCGRRLSVADTYAGKRGKCPHCKQVVRVPARPDASPEIEIEPPAPKSPAGPSARDLALLDLQPRSPQEKDSDEVADAQVAALESAQVAGDDSECEGPPRFTDAFLYPASLNGLVYIGIFAVGLWVIDVLGGVLSKFARHYGGVLALVLEVAFAGYILFYLGYCIFDSSKGERRAPAISTAHAPDLWDLVGQWGLLIGGMAICLWPAALFYGFTERTDVAFWSLAGVGLFFLPMALLTATLFAGIGALNPLLIVRSIVVTLPAYLVLILKLPAVVLLMRIVQWMAWRLPIPGVFFTAVRLYVLLVACYWIGSFYHRHKDRLDWGL